MKSVLRTLLLPIAIGGATVWLLRRSSRILEAVDPKRARDREIERKLREGARDSMLVADSVKAIDLGPFGD